MQLTPVRKTLLIALPLGMLIGFAGAVYAADGRLDDADAHVDQAIGLLTSAANPERKPEFGGHRVKAIEFLKIAKKEIQKAKDYANKPLPGPKPSSGPAPSGTPSPGPGPKGPPGTNPSPGPKGPPGKDPSPGPGKGPGKGPIKDPTPGPKTK